MNLVGAANAGSSALTTVWVINAQHRLSNTSVAQGLGEPVPDHALGLRNEVIERGRIEIRIRR